MQLVEWDSSATNSIPPVYPPFTSTIVCIFNCFLWKQSLYWVFKSSPFHVFLLHICFVWYGNCGNIIKIKNQIGTGYGMILSTLHLLYRVVWYVSSITNNKEEIERRIVIKQEVERNPRQGCEDMIWILPLETERPCETVSVAEIQTEYLQNRNLNSYRTTFCSVERSIETTYW
jgi:hypothetical protein